MGSVAVEAVAGNTVVDYMLSSPWNLLLSRIGDTLMLYLLLHSSIFQSLANHCCCQLAGPSVVKVARGYRQMAPLLKALHTKLEEEGKQQEANAAAASGAAAGGGGEVEMEMEVEVETDTGDRKRKRSNDTMATMRMGPMTQLEEVEQDDMEGSGEAAPPVMVQAKRRRLSSWQRHKAKAAATGEDQRNDLPPRLPSGTSAPPPQQQSQQQQQQQQKAHGRWKRNVPKPTDMVIPRTPIFYCSRFQKKAGLPSKHVFNVLKNTPEGARILYSSIFNPKYNPVGRTHNPCIPSRRAVIPQFPPRNIPKKHLHLIPLMEKMLKNAAKCPYKKILRTYCPLPLCLTEKKGGNEGLTTTAAEEEDKKEKDFDTLMNELDCLEQGDEGEEKEIEDTRKKKKENEKPSKSILSHLRHVPLTAAATTTTTTVGNINTRKRHLTGLGRLLLEAESQAAPALPTRGGAGGGKGGVSMSLSMRKKHDAHHIQREQAQQQKTASSSFINALWHPENNDTPLPPTQPLFSIQEEQQQEEDKLAPPINPANNETATTTTATDNGDVQTLATCFVPHIPVAGFLWAALRRIVPKPLLGNKRCQRLLQRSILRFVSLRRYEQMNVQQLMQKQKISGIAWLWGDDRSSTTKGSRKKKKSVPPSQAAAQQQTLALWLGWLFSVFIVPLIRAHFFCTESESYRQQVFYYRKKVWHRLSSATLDGLSGTQFAPLPTRTAESILKSRKLGVAKIRLIPKRLGMRCIVNMGRRYRMVFKAPKVRRRTSANNVDTEAAAATPQKIFSTINSQLVGIHTILKFEATRHPDCFGASLFSYNDIYCKLQPFIRSWKVSNALVMSRKTVKAVKKPYIVSVDVSRAFDHVDVTTLLDLVTPLFHSHQYLILKYNEIYTQFNDIKVVLRRMAVPCDVDSSRRRMGAALGVGAGALSFPAAAAQWAMTRKGKMFVDNVVYEKVTREQALGVLKEHLTANLVKLKKQWHYQCRGIAQGGSLSTLLCSLYLGHVEKRCLAPIIYSPFTNGGGVGGVSTTTTTTMTMTMTTNATAGDGGGGGSLPTGATTTTGRGALTSLARQATSTIGVQANTTTAGTARRREEDHNYSVLLRMVDDWLLITGDKTIAEETARCMLASIPAYNIFINPSKTKLSFPLRLPATTTTGTGTGTAAITANKNTTVVAGPDVFVSGDGSRFVKWCGLLINADTLEIQADYTRYAGEHIATSLTLPHTQRGIGAALAQKLCMYLRPKLHPLLLDQTINSPTTIRVNLYQLFVLAAMKFHCYVRSAMPTAATHNATLLFKAIETGVDFVSSVTRPRCVTSALHPDVTVHCDPNVSHAHVAYLGMYAFKTVLGRKGGVYGELVKKVEAALAAPPCARSAKALAEVVDPLKSTIMDAILY